MASDILEKILAEFAAQEGKLSDPNILKQIEADIGTPDNSGRGHDHDDGGDDHHHHHDHDHGGGDHHHDHDHDGDDHDHHCAPCFLAGVSIVTPSGDVRVEDLRRGDSIVIANGEARTIRWIGKRKISVKFADPQRAFPVRIRAGALADNTPARDLLVSPDHAMMVEGILIQASALVNGVSILRERDMPEEFIYYHIELDRHDLIFAEGALTETFVDNVDRMLFDNWAEHQSLYPNGNPIVEMPYPRAKAHRQVPLSIREKLSHRAAWMSASVVSSAA
jgi:hypothetical protein